jgi:hypothetical protein
MLFGIISDLAFGFAGTPKGEHRFLYYSETDAQPPAGRVN